MRARSPLPLLFAALALAAGLIAAALVLGLRHSSSVSAPAVPTGGAPEPAPDPAPELTPPPPREASQALPESSLEARWVCRSTRDGAPVQGVRLYSVDGPIAGPSDGKGSLEIPRDHVGRIWTAWAPGWSPRRVDSRPPFPEEILLEPATAGLAVRVNSSDPLTRITRTRVVPRGRPGAQGQPWTPRLEIEGALTAVGRQLPSGEYDVYVWLTREKGAPRALPRQRVELEPDRTLELELDAAVRTDRDVDG